MLLISHGAIGYLLYDKSQSSTYKWLAVIGAIFPDIPTVLTVFVLFFSNAFVGQGFSYEIWHDIFHQSNATQFWGTLLHSFPIWITLLLVGYFFKKIVVPLAIGALTHSVVDILTHNIASPGGAWNHFWPVRMEPINGLIPDYVTARYVIPIHIIWAIIFIPRIIKYYKKMKRRTTPLIDEK